MNEYIHKISIQLMIIQVFDGKNFMYVHYHSVLHIFVCSCCFGLFRFMNAFMLSVYKKHVSNTVKGRRKRSVFSMYNLYAFYYGNTYLETDSHVAHNNDFSFFCKSNDSSLKSPAQIVELKYGVSCEKSEGMSMKMST
jgi:hypothetical protein